MKKLLVYHIGHTKGGVSEVVFNLLKCEYFKDFEITLITLDNLQTNYMKEIENRGYKLIMLRSISNSLIGHYSDVKRIFQDKYDFFWYNTGELLDYKILKAAKNSGAQVITHIHGLFLEDDYYNRFKKMLIKVLKPYIEKRYYKYNDVFIGCVDEIREKMINPKLLKGKRFFLLRNSVDIEKFKFNKEKRQQMRREIDAKEGDIVLGAVGALCKIKNYIFLLNVLTKLPLNYKLILIGEGDDKITIEQKIINLNLQERVKLLGRKDNVSDYFSAMDIYCLSSLHEGLGLAAIEAQACNLPVVIGDNLSKLHVANERAKIALFNDINSWRKEILSVDVYHNRELYDDSWINQYDLSSMQKKFCEILNSMI